MIVSKGHAAALTYATLAESGFFPVDRLEDYGRNGSQLFGHVTTGAAGVELSTGSLGHGLPVGTGMALAGKRDGRHWRVFVLMSDGECDEGSNWEAILFASHHRLDNLVVIVDYNRIQSLDSVEATLSLEPFVDKWRAFGWEVTEVDGHDIDALLAALTTLPLAAGRPTAVIAHTIKGRGVSFMEGKVAWHYRFASGEDLNRALAEVDEA
jgi:transketolase